MADEADDIVSTPLPPSKITSTTQSTTQSTLTNNSCKGDDGADLYQQPTYCQPQANSEEKPPNMKRRSYSTMNIMSDENGLKSYFVGPLDLDRHSKLPFFMRMHGSVLPKMLVPLLLIGVWATLITCITKFVHDRKEIRSVDALLDSLTIV